MSTRLLVLLACMLCCLGCAAGLPPAKGPSEVRERWLPSFVFGIWGDPSVDVRDLCPSGAATGVSVGSNVGTVAVSLFTFGMFTPRKAWVACVPVGS